MGKELTTSSVLLTPVGLLSFVKFFPPEKSKKPNPETGEYDRTWTASIVFDPEEDEKTKERFAAIKKVQQMLIQEKWNGKKPGGFRPCWSDGNDEERYPKDNDLYTLYEDKYIITVRSKNIEVIPQRKTGEKKGKAILEPCTKKNFFSGCFGFATIKLFAYDVETEGGKSRGVSASLQNIYLTKLGEPLGFTRRSAAEDLEEAEDADDDMEVIDDAEDLMDEDDDDGVDFIPKNKKKPETKGKKKSRSTTLDEDDEF